MVRERLGKKISIGTTENQKTALWKRRIEEKIVQVRRDISYLEEMMKGTVLKQRTTDQLNRRHQLLKKWPPQYH